MNDIFNTIEEAIEDIKKGKMVIVVDDEDRENEGDFIIAADLVTDDSINFMVSHGKGLVCVPLTEERCQQIGLDLMVSNGTDPLGTAFTVPVDLKGNGVTTGISTSDRAKTIKALVNPNISSNDFTKPGHIFPLIAKNGGVLRRTGHTEAAVDLAKLAGLNPAGVIVEILNDDGTMARLPQLIEISKKRNIKLINIEQLVAYRLKHDKLIHKKSVFNIKTIYGNFLIHIYKQSTHKKTHFALTKGIWKPQEAVLTRIQKLNSNEDTINFLIGNSNTLQNSMKAISKEKKASILFINADDGGNIFEQLKNHTATDNKNIKIENIEDARDFGIGAQILHDLRISKIKLLTNSKQPKRIGMVGYGLEIVDYINF